MNDLIVVGKDCAVAEVEERSKRLVADYAPGIGAHGVD